MSHWIVLITHGTFHCFLQLIDVITFATTDLYLFHLHLSHVNLSHLSYVVLLMTVVVLFVVCDSCYVCHW